MNPSGSTSLVSKATAARTARVLIPTAMEIIRS
jgi:hypothetical protein